LNPDLPNTKQDRRLFVAFITSLDALLWPVTCSPEVTRESGCSSKADVNNVAVANVVLVCCSPEVYHVFLCGIGSCVACRVHKSPPLDPVFRPCQRTRTCPRVTLRDLVVVCRECLADPGPAPNLEDHPVSAAPDCLFTVCLGTGTEGALFRSDKVLLNSNQLFRLAELQITKNLIKKYR
jgi:hypothetical protein